MIKSQTQRQTQRQTQSQPKAIPRPSLPLQHRRWVAALLTLTTAAALFAMLALHGAQAQTSTPVSADSAGIAIVGAPSPAAAPAASGPATQPPRKYALQDVERVFNYLDSNHDGKISRAESATFKNIASHFDGADIDKDNFLTRQEFDNAINGFKPQ